MQVAIWKLDMARSEKRPLPDSNRGWRICNPLPYRLAKGPLFLTTPFIGLSERTPLVKLYSPAAWGITRFPEVIRRTLTIWFLTGWCAISPFGADTATFSIFSALAHFTA